MGRTAEDQPRASTSKGACKLDDIVGGITELFRPGFSKT